MPSRSDKLSAALNTVAPSRPAERPARALRPETLYPFSEQVDLPAEASDLPEDVQDIARQLVSTKRRIGRDLLDAARLVAEARGRTEHGQWLLFLRVTNTSPDVGEYLQSIWRRATEHPAFREAIERGWLSEGAARRIARDSVPNDVVDAILMLPEPPTVRTVEAKLRELRPARPGKDDMPTRVGMSGGPGLLSADEMPTRVGISEASPGTVIEPLAAEDYAAVARIRELLARYRANPGALSGEDRDILRLLAADLQVVLASLD